MRGFIPITPPPPKHMPLIKVYFIGNRILIDQYENYIVIKKEIFITNLFMTFL